MFLLPDQQLRRADRVMRQRLVPYVHETLSHCQLRAFANEGEPEQSADFLARVRENKVDFLDFMVPGAWGTIWGTTWFEVRGRIDRESVKGRAVELVVDLGWKRHRGPGFQAEGLCYRPDGSVIKAVNPDNCWIPLIDANGVANVELDDAGRFTVYVEAASNPLVEADLPFAPMNLGERADGRPSDYVLTTMDVCAFNQNVFDYLMDLETVTSLMRELKDDDPRYWQLAKALQRSLNTYDERDIAGTLEPAKEKLAGVLSEPAYSSVIHDKDLSRNAILLYGYSDGGGGPTREMVARIRRDHDLAGAPSIDFGTPDELFDRVRHDIVDEGELYLELHRATLTSQQEMKRGCRREENLLRTTEYLCAAASVFNPEYRYPREELDGIWKTLLLNQFHDILPGSAIAWVHRQARADYVRDIARLRDIAAEAGASIASARDDADMRSNAAIVPYTAKNGDLWIACTAAVGTQDDDANGTDAVADESTIATTCDDGRIILDNGLLRAIIAPDGTVHSLIDLDNGHELVPDGSGIGHYELLRDEPYEWDAWDIQRDAFLSAEGIDDSHVERVTETKRGGATVHVSSTADGVSIDACITLRAKSKSLEFRTKVDWRASERFLKVDIPMAIQADRAQYECQYGMVERPIQKNTRSDEAKYESCTHRFVRVADAGYAAAVVNASTYGSDVSPIHRNTASGPVRGTMIRLSLLSSPLYPDPNTDKGVHEFAWNVVADASMPAVLDEANRLNAAVLPAVPAFDPLAQLNPVDGVMVLDWVKLADDGSGDLILRVYEAVGGEAHARLAVNAALGKATVRECSIMEDARLDAELPAAFADGDPSVARTAQGAMLSLHPFQLATLRVSCGSDGGNTDGNESGSLR